MLLCFPPSNGTSKLHFSTLIFTFAPPISSSSSYAASSPAPVLREDATPIEFGDNGSRETAKRTLEELLVVRRPVTESTDDGENGEDADVAENSSSTSSLVIDTELSKFAKKMPIFEPRRVGSSSSGEKPLVVNLDLALCRAKVLGRNFRYKEAEEILQKCWAVLEYKMGNIRRARQLIDAATVADKKHIAAWHGWAVMELKVRNVKKAIFLVKDLRIVVGMSTYTKHLQCLKLRQTEMSKPDTCSGMLLNVIPKAARVGLRGLSLRYNRKTIALPDNFLSLQE